MNVTVLINLFQCTLIVAIVGARCFDNKTVGCIVGSKLGCDITSTEKFDWRTYFTNETKQKIYVAFVEKKVASDSDSIYFERNKVYRMKTRNHKYIKTEYLPKAPLPLAWSNFSMEVFDKGTITMMINSVEFPIEFDYPVRYLSIISDAVAACSNGRPTWEIREGRNSTIPMNLDENINFSLYSNTSSFSPAIYMNDLLINLQYNSGVEIGNSKKSRPLPEGIYDFILKKEENTWILSQEKHNENPEVIFEFKMTDKLLNLGLTSLDKDFQFQLKSADFDEEKSGPSIAPPANDDCTPLKIVLAVLSIMSSTLIVFLLYLLLKCKKMQEKSLEIDPGQKKSLIRA